MKQLIIVLFFTLSFTGCGKDNSVENVFASISILSDLGDYVPKSKSDLSINEAKYFRNSYCRAHDLGKEFKSGTLKRKLGNEFAGKWKKDAIPALKIICEHWRDLDKLKSGYQFSQKALSKIIVSMNKLESFRMFYVAWRKS